MLYDSFLTWHRLRTNELVKHITIEGIKRMDNWRQAFPPKFHPIHAGKRECASVVIGRGQYANVYQKGSYAYKLVRIPGVLSRESDGRAIHLKINLKELCFFHSMDHPNVMRPLRSQIIMEQGVIRKLIHKQPLSKYTLSSMIKSHDMTCVQDVVHVVRGVVKGLIYMHDRDIVHGDMKPDNILITEHKEGLLTDFTLTTFQDRGHEMSDGSLFWRAPECLLGISNTKATDVWGLGMMIMDCLYGCVYAQDVWGVTDDQDGIMHLISALGRPPIKWFEKHMGPKWVPILLEADKLEHKDRPIMVMSESDSEAMLDLLDRIFRWDPEDRITVHDIMNHKAFTSVADAIPAVVAPPPTVITWKNRDEKEQFVNKVRYHHFNTFKRKMDEEEDYLLRDTVLLVKVVLDRLRERNFTFVLDDVIDMCCTFEYYLWKEYSTDDPLLESKIYHIMILTDYQTFIFNPVETYENMSLIAPTVAKRSMNIFL